MLSFYDALAFSVQKRSLLISLIVSLLMLFFFILIGISWERDFGLFTSFGLWLQNSVSGLENIAKVLEDDEAVFWSTLFKKTLWLTALFFFFGFSFFLLQLIIAKKALFNQPSHFTASFFLITLSKLMILVSPILYVSYTFVKDILKSGFSYVSSYVMALNPVYKFPFTDRESLLLVAVIFVYFLYSISLFIGRFSFLSLFNVKLFLKHILVVIELIFKIILSHALFLAGLAVLGFICWNMDSLYVFFFVLFSYLLWMLVSPARWIFVLPFVVMILGGSYFGFTLGEAFFRNYLFRFLLFSLVYFCFFFFWSIFWSVLAYLFASTAFVFRFNQTPARDIKKKAPEKLRRIDELYNAYLTEHKNNTQDNFFHHMEEK